MNNNFLSDNTMNSNTDGAETPAQANAQKRNRHHDSRHFQQRRSTPAALPSRDLDRAAQQQSPHQQPSRQSPTLPRHQLHRPNHPNSLPSSTNHSFHSTSDNVLGDLTPLLTPSAQNAGGSGNDMSISTPLPVAPGSQEQLQPKITIDLERSGIGVTNDDDDDDDDDLGNGSSRLSRKDDSNFVPLPHFADFDDELDAYAQVNQPPRHRRPHSPPGAPRNNNNNNNNNNNEMDELTEVRLSTLMNPLGSTLSTPDGGIIFSPMNGISQYQSRALEEIDDGDDEHSYNPTPNYNSDFDSEFLDLLKEFAQLELPQYYSEQEVCPLCSAVFPTTSFSEHVYECIKSLDQDEKKQIELMDEQLALMLAMEEVEDFDYLTTLQRQTGFDASQIPSGHESYQNRPNLPNLPPPSNETLEERELRFQREDAQRRADNQKRMERFLANQALVFNQYKYHGKEAPVENKTAAEAECCVCGLAVPKADLDQHVLGCLNTSPQFRLGTGRKNPPQQMPHQSQQQRNRMGEGDGDLPQNYRSNGAGGFGDNAGGAGGAGASPSSGFTPTVLPNPFLKRSTTNSSSSALAAFPAGPASQQAAAQLLCQPITADNAATLNPRLFGRSQSGDDSDGATEDRKNNDLPNFNDSDDEDESGNSRRRHELLQLSRNQDLRDGDGNDNDDGELPVIELPVLDEQPSEGALNAQQIGLMARMVHDHTTNAPNRDTSASLHSLLTTFSALGLNKTSLRQARDQLIASGPATNPARQLSPPPAPTPQQLEQQRRQLDADLINLLDTVPRTVPFLTEEEKAKQQQQQQQQQQEQQRFNQ